MSDGPRKQTRSDGSAGRGRRGPRRHPDIEIARLLVKKGLLGKTEAMEALKDQKSRAAAGKTRLPLVQLLVKRKWVRAEELPRVQDEIRRHTYICNACEARAVIVPSSSRSDGSCPRCGAPIATDGPSEAPAEGPADFGSGRDLNFPGPPGVDRFAKGGRAFGRYELMDELGRGAMGVVYRAKHVDLGKEVALKVLLAGDEARDAQIARFRREAAAVQKLRHPGIVAIHDFGSEGDVYFLTMDLVPGGLTLHKLWKDSAKAPLLRERVAQVAGVAHAIDHANAKGIVHRDLKPANVLLDPEGNVLVADFGLAKDEGDDAALTLSQDRLGTPLFMAPEQVKRGAAAVDHRADIWALGIMTFVAATGRYPFRGRTIMSLYVKILQEEPDWDGTRSSSPDRDGFGKAPPPREMADLEKRGETTQSETDVASYKDPKKKKTATRPVAKLERPAEPPSPPAFVPPRDLEGKPVPADLRSIIEMALAKDPDQRYESAGALARDLERFARGQPVRAKPPSELGKMWRRAKRRKGTWAALVALVLAPAIAWSVHYGLEKKKLADQEKLEREKAEAAQRAAEAQKKEGDAAAAACEAIWSRDAVGSPSMETWALVAEKLGKVCQDYPKQPAPFFKRGLARAFALELDQAHADLYQAKQLAGTGLSASIARSAFLLAVLRNDGEEAERIARDALAREDDPGLRVGLARVLIRRGQPGEAETALAPLQKDGKDAEALAVASAAALALGDATRALELAERALKLPPERLEAVAAASRAALALGHFDRARDLGKRARDGFDANGPTEARYFAGVAKAQRFGQTGARVLDAGECAAILAPWSPVPSFWRADALEKDEHDVQGALRDLEKALERDPTFDEASELRAQLLLARHDAEGLLQAERAFKEELARRSTRREVHLDLATVLLARNELAAARSELEAYRSSGGAQSRLVRLECELARIEGQKRALEPYEKLKPTGLDRRRDAIAAARVRLGRREYALALDELDEKGLFKAQDPRWGGFYRLPSGRQVVNALRCFALAGLNRLDDARSDLERAASERRQRAGTYSMAPEAAPDVLSVTPEVQAHLEKWSELVNRGRSRPRGGKAPPDPGRMGDDE